LKFLARGLYALILTLTLQSQLLAEYLYKDDVVHNPKFTNEIETLGGLLFQKTGIKLKLIMLKELPQGTSMLEYEKSVLEKESVPTIVLSFSEMDKAVDIEVNDTSLYKYFDKERVLSPVTSYAQALIMSLSYARTWDDFVKIMTHTGGSILPLLGVKSKEMTAENKYSAAMFNGYLDIAQHIAKAKGVELGEGYDSKTNQDTLFFIKILFYGFVLYAMIMYIRRLIYKRRHKDEVFKQW